MLKKKIIKSSRARSQSIVDLTNQRFGKLTVLKLLDKHITRGAVWKCQCDCGAICEVSSAHLQRNHTLSCGCLKSKGEEKISKVLSSLNIYFKKEKVSMIVLIRKLIENYDLIFIY